MERGPHLLGTPAMGVRGGVEAHGLVLPALASSVLITSLVDKDRKVSR